MNYEEFDKVNNTDENAEEIEKAILVGVLQNEHGLERTCRESMDELALLADTAGAIVLDKVLQSRKSLDSTFHIGKGKAEEIAVLRESLDANIIIFDDELSGAQIRNLEEVIGASVIDRTALILDIFAKRAQSREGKIQVELAQLKYRLPRLIGLGNQLSRLGGGIGTRGPGEKKLETDRRHIHRRISALEEELEEIKKQRNIQRSLREKSKIPVVALVGYTNAGKSTLMNRLTDAGVLAEDKLFATLDPIVRELELSDGQKVLLIDTVGFIRKLPHHLVEAFKSTLEETLYADVLIHVIDSSSNEYEIQKQVVLNILSQLGASNKPIVTVYNKIDILKDEVIDTPEENSVKISAKRNIGIEELITVIENALPEKLLDIEGIIPYCDGYLVSLLHEKGLVRSEEYREEGIKINAQVKKDFYQKYSKHFNVKS